MASDHPAGAETVAASRLPAIATSRLLAVGGVMKLAETEVPLLFTPPADWTTVQLGIGVEVGVLVGVGVAVEVGVGVAVGVAVGVLVGSGVSVAVGVADGTTYSMCNFGAYDG